MVFTLLLQGLAFILASSACIFCQRMPPSWQNPSRVQTAREPGDYNWDLKRLEELFYHYIWVSRKVTVKLPITVDGDREGKLFPTYTLSHSTLSMQCWQLHIYNREKSRSLLTKPNLISRDQNVIRRWMTRTCTFHSLCFHIVRFLKKKTTTLRSTDTNTFIAEEFRKEKENRETINIILLLPHPSCWYLGGFHSHLFALSGQALTGLDRPS